MRNTRNPHKCAEIIHTGKPIGHKGSFLGSSEHREAGPGFKFVTHYWFRCRRCGYVYSTTKIGRSYSQNKRLIALNRERYQPLAVV